MLGNKLTLHGVVNTAPAHRTHSAGRGAAVCDQGKDKSTEHEGFLPWTPTASLYLSSHCMTRDIQSGLLQLSALTCKNRDILDQ